MVTVLGPDLESATDQILAQFRAAWIAGAGAANSNYGSVVPAVEWPNVAVDGPPLTDGNVPWARINLQHGRRGQRAMGGSAGNLYTATGIVTVQIFVPSGKQGLVNPQRLGKVALDAFEGKRTADVLFRNAEYREVGAKGPWFQANVMADFTYDAVH
jgi:hypothetical protein